MRPVLWTFSEVVSPAPRASELLIIKGKQGNGVGGWEVSEYVGPLKEKIMDNRTLRFSASERVSRDKKDKDLLLVCLFPRAIVVKECLFFLRIFSDYIWLCTFKLSEKS